MTTMAIVGAGPGLGLAAARRFGREGFDIALIARGADKLHALAQELGTDGITARGYVADVRDPEALTGALATAAADLGPVEVVQYSPVPAREFMKPVLETAADDLRGPLEMSVLGPAAAVQAVLPGMRALGRGTILFPNGSSAVRPRDAVTGTSVAFAGEAAYATLLHDALAPENIHVAQLIIPLGIGGGEPDHDADALADRLWSLHSERGAFRTFVRPLD
ncbi:SDR family NAD(P)-dependent oxidoreductase [Microbacterium excoecariae]|uniref:SDR family NAD(P)-dependent oxidoreductase n=1 Tax=Microbacterium excoecariae TaxID=2715210 RepID=UPI0014099C1B|nr:SDR family NAD(P)-dependent oxidoreductase [Microbacterium excoecariae]NHI17520.1 SDR family NAD(P)-dependent oxidoreductase [Microbacterium excoecariae]